MAAREMVWVGARNTKETIVTVENVPHFSRNGPSLPSE